MDRRRIFIFSGIILAILVSVLLFSSAEDHETLITTQVRRGPFDVRIFSSGQLESENSQNIDAPEKMKDRSLRIYELSITDLIEEGTLVDSGDYVATLDHKAVEEQLKTVQDEMEKTLTELQDAKIDSNLTLSNQRDQIVNTVLELEEKKIEMEQSIYESPAIQQKKKMDYDKAARKYEQEKKALELKTQQQANNVNRRFINYRQLQEREKGLQELFNSLVIYAPKSGILTYMKYPWGEIVSVGSMISMYRGTIAKIPDMSNLISRTFINEIDISKVKQGQQVEIGIDAFPEKKLTGEVVSMANVGQAMPNSDAKVFEVKIKIFDKDEDLKPAMTTSNIIFAGTYSDTLFIPSDAVFRNDSLQYVYVKERSMRKQIVSLGDQNENFILVKEGLKEGEEICLVEPSGSLEMKFEGLDIYDRMKQQAEEEQKLAEQEREKYKNNGATMEAPSGMPPGVTIRK
ncbi:MAG: efflux RND transporter periplasmic adaptor subunit [Prolixibacteraceae bacterium]|jgi:multidrug efflux pump subunit AcrA (membrane-fusion protein)|nr:efflux RND transporter periplasmic adaptor subunit [Prolixibacteraceae bacterium]